MSEDFEGIVGGAGDVGIRIRREATQVRLEARGSDITGDEQDDRQVFAPSNGLGHEGHGALAALHEEHAGDGSFALVRRAERLDQRAAGGATPGGRPEYAADLRPRVIGHAGVYCGQCTGQLNRIYNDGMIRYGDATGQNRTLAVLSKDSPDGRQLG